MLKLNEETLDQLESRVAHLESGTTVEVVMVMTARADNYKDLSLLTAIVSAWTFLLLAVFSPWEVDSYWLPLDILLIGGLSYYLSAHSPPWIRALSSKKRRMAAVKQGAERCFTSEQVASTLERTGLLVYVAFLEQQVYCLADGGITATIPEAKFNSLPWSTKNIEGLEAGLDALDALLQEALPSREENPDELPNRPRLL